MEKLKFWLKKTFRLNNVECRHICMNCRYYEICSNDGVEDRWGNYHHSGGNK